MSDPELKTLFSEMATDSTHAFRSVFDAYYDKIYSTALVYGKSHELAQDVVQQVFMKLWERRNELNTVNNPEAWLHTAARYTTKDAIEKEMVREKFKKQILQSFTNESNSPDQLLVKRERDELIKRALQSLSARQYGIYRLSREEGLTYEEIGQQLGISRETVKEHISKALKTIHSFLRDNRDNLISLFIFLFL